MRSKHYTVSVHDEDGNKSDGSRYEIEKEDPPTTLSSSHQEGCDDTISDSEIRLREKTKIY